jgi:hypothetical protein
VNKRTFKLAHERRKALEAVQAAPADCAVEILPPSKSRDQEERYHAMLGDIAKQCMHLNESQDQETWKRLCVDQFRRDTLSDPEIGEYWKGKGLRIIPSIDGSCVVVLGEQTRRFPRKVASAFVEWLFSFGAERDVRWTDPSAPPVEAYEEAHV